MPAVPEVAATPRVTVLAGALPSSEPGCVRVGLLSSSDQRVLRAEGGGCSGVGRACAGGAVTFLLPLPTCRATLRFHLTERTQGHPGQQLAQKPEPGAALAQGPSRRHGLWGRWPVPEPQLMAPGIGHRPVCCVQMRTPLGGTRNAGYQHRPGCHTAGNRMSGPDSGSICD